MSLNEAEDDANRHEVEQKIKGIVRSLSPDSRSVLTEVLRVERQKLHMKNPVGIVDDVAGVIRALIK